MLPKYFRWNPNAFEDTCTLYQLIVYDLKMYDMQTLHARGHPQSPCSGEHIDLV